jgi:hypothetical protein
MSKKNPHKADQTMGGFSKKNATKNVAPLR